MNTQQHPGEHLRHVLAPFGLSVKELAEHLHMSRVALSRVLNGRAAISPDLAIRLEMAGINTALFWVSRQSDYDLAQALTRDQPTVRPFQ